MAVTVDVLHGIITPSSFYSQIADATPSPGLELLLAGGAGQPTPLFAGVRAAMPRIGFRTPQLATLFAECTSALHFCKNLSAGNTDLHYRPITQYGTRGALTATTRFRMTAGFMAVKSLSLAKQGESMADVDLMALYDGTNEPLVPAGSQTAASTATAAEHFGLGPVTVSDVAIENVLSARIDFGQDFFFHSATGKAYPTWVGIRTLAPVVTLEMLAADAWVTYGLLGAALSGSAKLVIYGRKVNSAAAGGVAYVADATAEHLKFVGAGGFVTIDQSSGGGNSEVKTTLKINLLSPNTTTIPLTVSAASAIT